jgi:hypothetical protein
VSGNGMKDPVTSAVVFATTCAPLDVSTWNEIRMAGTPMHTAVSRGGAITESDSGKPMTSACVWCDFCYTQGRGNDRPCPGPVLPGRLQRARGTEIGLPEPTDMMISPVYNVLRTER